MSNQNNFAATQKGAEIREKHRAEYAAYIARIAACPKAVQDITDDITATQRKIGYTNDPAQIYRLTCRMQELIEEQYAVMAVNGTPVVEAASE